MMDVNKPSDFAPHRQSLLIIVNVVFYRAYDKDSGFALISIVEELFATTSNFHCWDELMARLAEKNIMEQTSLAVSD